MAKKDKNNNPRRELDIYTKLGTEFKAARVNSSDRGQIISFFTAFAARMLGEYGVDSCDDIISAFNMFYDRVIQPIDVPGVPNFVEPAFDEAVQKLCVAMIRKFCDQIHEHEKKEKEKSASPAGAKDSPNLGK